MSYIYIYGLGFCEKPELCEHVFVYYLSLSLPSNPSDHYEWGFCQVICGTHNPSAKSFLGIVFHKLLFIVLVSLLARFSFWWRHLWPTSLNTPLQKEKFVPKKPLSFYFHWVFFPQFQYLLKRGQNLWSHVSMIGRYMLFFPVISLIECSWPP